MSINMWPKPTFGGPRITVVNAEAQKVDDHYRVIFHPSSGDSLTVQLPDTALRNLVETAAACLGLGPKSKGSSARTKRSKR